MTDTKQQNPRTQAFLRTMATAGKYTGIFIFVAMFGAIIASVPRDIILIANGTNTQETIKSIAQANGMAFVLITVSTAITISATVGAIYAIGISKQIIHDPDLRRNIKKQISNIPNLAMAKFNTMKNKITNWNICNNIKTK